MDLLAPFSVCVIVCVCISNMDLPLWASKFSEDVVRGSCIHFAETADNRPCVVHVLAVLSLCVCVSI
jgi:hypothetical protein